LANEAMDAAKEGRTWVRSVGGDGAPDGELPADTEDSPTRTDPRNSPGKASIAVVEQVARSAVRDGKPDRAPALDPDGTADTSPTAQDPAAALPFPRTGATTFLLVRHGETTWGAEARFAGREDVPLTARGARQAQAVAARIRPLAPSIVLTSPLQRCRTTAEAIAGAARVRVVVEERLNDGLLGQWTGLRAVEIAQRWPAEFAAWRSDPDAEPPGGESFTGIRERIRPVLNETVESFRGHTVVLVTHAATSKMILATALNVDSAMGYRVRVDTGSLTGFTVQPDGTVLVWVVNDTGHLTGPIAEPAAR
jgi:broad specificity phosphatase PhoE